ncbi:MAG TPA: TA system VapC family ribonuclease toxin [Caulobacteraceae bacterium]
MIAVDANILVYAHRVDSPFHAAATARMVALAEGQAAWAIPWPCVHEFLAIVTHPRIYAPPSPLAVALDAMDAWLQSPNVVLLAEGSTHWPSLRRLLVAGRIAGGRVHDARIAALCLQHGVRELWSSDRDFSRFPELVTVNPMVGV